MERLVDWLLIQGTFLGLLVKLLVNVAIVRTERGPKQNVRYGKRIDNANRIRPDSQQCLLQLHLQSVDVTFTDRGKSH
uniref:Putative secreted protein n=1 Tax=Anopheles darlingi TaxID=43151 RepID=A0A2M4DAH4_ANODA